MLLPFRPKPKEDELLSSWLVRLARGYGMGIDDFLLSTEIGAYIRSSDCDRIQSAGLIKQLHDCTGTTRAAIERTLLIAHVSSLFSDGVQSRSANWSWLIPLGRSGRSTPPLGFQICPHCLSDGESYYRWQWRVALFFRCMKHHCLLVDECPQCGSRIHPYTLSLLGLRHACGEADGTLERCDHCSFDFHSASTRSGRASSVEAQSALQLRLSPNNDSSNMPADEYFAVLRHIIDLLDGENTGLDELREVVAKESGIPRVDPGRSYEPDLDIPSFEEMAVEKRELILEAAFWLVDRWPSRFLKCCRKAGVRHPALNRGKVCIRWFNKAVTEAYKRAG
jgi:hypothetical protein